MVVILNIMHFLGKSIKNFSIMLFLLQKGRMEKNRE